MKIIWALALFIMANLTFGQQPVIDKVNSEICQILSKIETPIDNLTISDSQNIIRRVLNANALNWSMALAEYKENTGRGDYDFDQYFQHVLQLDCKHFRTIDKKLDRYLVDKKNLRPLYLRAKEFTILLEDNASNEYLYSFLSDLLKNHQTTQLLNTSKEQISICKRTTTLNIMSVNAYTFRVRYFDYLTNDPEFQIDLIFNNSVDLKVDKIEIKSKELLMIELKKRQELNKGIESGDIKLPPPPAKKKKG